MKSNEILYWLQQNDEIELEKLWNMADTVRCENVGDQVHLRGLIEISNICSRQCLYCGIRAGNSNVKRYKLSSEEVMNAARFAVKFGYGSIVIQSGEDSAMNAKWIADLVRCIKTETNLAITLSLGEQSVEDWALWKNSGADRYLLRFETSNPALFNVIHPPRAEKKSRIEMLMQLRELGYEIGSGIMVGIPGQEYNDLVNDINLFRELDLDMIGLGPFLPHPGTPLGKLFDSDPKTGLFSLKPWTDEQQRYFAENGLSILDLKNQVSPSDVLVFKMLAIVRCVCPKANIPSTTAIATIDTENGRKNGLNRGANVVMPNLTPIQYREQYEIYPNKAAIRLTPEQTNAQVMQHLSEIGRIPGTGKGSSPRLVREP